MAAVSAMPLPSVEDIPRSKGMGVSAGDVLALVVPASLFLHLHFVGEVYVAEGLLLMLLLPLLLDHVRDGVRSVPRTFPLLLAVWLYGQVLTDVYRETALHNLARGWANIAFTFTDFLAIFLLLDERPRRYLLFTLGLAVGLLADYVVHPSGLAAGDAWKFGISTPLTLGLVLIACTNRVRRISFGSGLVLAVAALLNFLHDFRSLAGILFLGALYLLAADGLRARRGGSAAIPMKTLVRLAVVCGAGAAIFVSAYSYFVSRGDLGSAAQTEYQLQSSNQYGLIGGGRPETAVALRAIADSPILGHGSWPDDPKYLQDLAASGVYVSAAAFAGGQIPSHSFLTDAWVAAGILGAPVWIWVFLLAIRGLVRQFETNDRLAPLTAYAAISLLWAIPFSPYGGTQRVFTPFKICLLLFVIERARVLRKGET